MARDYLDQLVLELRGRDLSGARIGEAVAEVEAHVADSGDDPVEAFGPAAQYARQVAGAVPAAPSAPMSWWARAQTAAIGAGGLLLMDGVLGLIDGRGATVTPGKLATIALIPLAAPVVVRAFTRAPAGPESRTALAIRQWVVPVGCLTAIFALLAATQWLFAEPVLLRYPAGLAVLAGLTLSVPLVFGPGDPVIDPRTGGTRYGRARLLIAAAVLGLLALQVLTVILLGLLGPDGGWRR